jgi:hypothetical protein
MRRAARADENQAAIVAALRKMGAAVTSIHRVGQGVSDLLVSWRQRWYVLEVKRDHKSKLTPDEKDWIGQQHAPVFVVTSAIEAINFMQGVRP